MKTKSPIQNRIERITSLIVRVNNLPRIISSVEELMFTNDVPLKEFTNLCTLRNNYLMELNCKTRELETRHGIFDFQDMDYPEDEDNYTKDNDQADWQADAPQQTLIFIFPDKKPKKKQLPSPMERHLQEKSEIMERLELVMDKIDTVEEKLFESCSYSHFMKLSQQYEVLHKECRAAIDKLGYLEEILALEEDYYRINGINRFSLTK